MTFEQNQQKIKRFFETAQALSEKKNKDYAHGDDPFRNFRSVGEPWVEIGFYTRMSDKMSRLRTFIERGTLEVKGESIEDTLIDLANYCALLNNYIEEKRMKSWTAGARLPHKSTAEELAQNPVQKVEIPTDEEVPCCRKNTGVAISQ